MLFFLAFIAYCIGIASSIYHPMGIYIGLLVLLIIIWVGWWRNMVIIGIILGIGAWWWYMWHRENTKREASYQQLWDLTQGFSGSHTVEWMIDKILYKNDFNTTYRLNIANIANWSPKQKKTISSNDIYLSVSIPNNLKIDTGDTIEYSWKIQSSISFPISGYGWYSWYYELYGKSSITTFKKISNRENTILDTTRDWARWVIFRGFPEDIAGIVLGMTIGDIDLLWDAVKKNFTLSGITHILVVSGSNIAFVIIIITGILRYFPIHQKIQIWIVISFVVFYSVLVGWDMPVIRAMMMGLITYIAIEWWKKVSSISILILIGFLILLYSPLSLIYDAGFGLSFMGTIWILLLYPHIEKTLSIISMPKFIKDIVGISLSASIWSSIVVIYYFWSIPLFGIVANILIGGLLGWILFASILYLAISLLWAWALYIWWWLIYLPVTYINQISIYFWGLYSYVIPQEYISTISLFLLWISVSFLFLNEKNRLLESK